MPPLIHPVVLCGGVNTHLWPASRQALPGQFTPIIDGKSLLQLSLERLRGLGPRITCIGAEEHRFMLQEAMEASQAHGRQILEPETRGTAASIAVAALMAEPEELLLVTPANHRIPDVALFESTVKRSLDAAIAGYVVIFGVTPSFSGSNFSCVEPGALLPLGEDGPAAHVVSSFRAELSAEGTKITPLRGDTLWSTGIIVAKAATLLDALEACAPDILSACRQATLESSSDGSFTRLDNRTFASCRSASFDSAVLEKHLKTAVIPFEGAWCDVSSWGDMAASQTADAAGNRSGGKGVLVDARNTFVHAPTRLVVALGTEDLVIVDTQDAVLVANVDSIHKIEEAISVLAASGRAEASAHRRVARPWGAYDGVDAGDRFQVKRLTVKPGAKLSLQMHYHRAEHWMVVKGTAMVTRGDDTILLRENESIYIPLGVTHRLENPGKTMLEVIEVQSGGYLGEDDIVRFDDTYGRVTQIKKVLKK